MVKYASRYTGLRIVIEPDKYLYLPTGEKQFKPGKNVRFISGLYQTDDKEIIKFMEDYCKKNTETFILEEVKAKKKKPIKPTTEDEPTAGIIKDDPIVDDEPIKDEL